MHVFACDRVSTLSVRKTVRSTYYYLAYTYTVISFDCTTRGLTDELVYIFDCYFCPVYILIKDSFPDTRCN